MHSIEILDKLRVLKPKLASNFGLAEIGLFGSFAREDFSERSDIDLLVSFNRPIGFEIVDFVLELEKALNRTVDVMTKNSLKSPLKEIIESEVKYV